MTPEPGNNSFMRRDEPTGAADRPAESAATRPSQEPSFLKPHQPPFLSLPPMRYQNRYVWLILVSALDLILTMLVLYVWTGYEVNPVAASVIQTMGFGGAIGLKFGLVLLVILICELVGRRRDRDGRSLATGAILISAVPVVYTFILLFRAGPPPHLAG